MTAAGEQAARDRERMAESKTILTRMDVNCMVPPESNKLYVMIPSVYVPDNPTPIYHNIQEGRIRGK